MGKILKDGYYLSTYIAISDYCNLYDVYTQRHDQNVSLWKKKGDDIELVHFWELERESRLKHHEVAFYDKKHARESINKLLERYDLSLDDMNEVWGTPLLAESWDYVNDTEYSYHSLCHLFSAIMLDSELFYNETILALSVDLASDYDTEEPRSDLEYTGCVVRKGKIEYFHIESPGPLWAVASRERKMQEGTLMALAYASKTKKTSSIKFDEVHIRNAERKYCEDIFEQSIGAVKGENCEAEHLLDYDKEYTAKDNITSAVMKEIQHLSEHIMERQIVEIIEKYGLDPECTYLAISGGFGLNCPTNAYLMKRFGFKGFIAPPCINDSGQSLGVALYMFYRNMDKVNFKFRSAFYGDSFHDENEILDYLDKEGFIKSVSAIEYDVAVQDIIEDPIVWFDGKAEIGPRALGHRSLIADSRFQKSKDKLNIIKNRQMWRPVAPIILEECLDDWFEDAYPSPYMLHTFQIKKNKLDKVKAILHNDNSARIQTICRIEETENLYNLIQAFYKATGIPIICNTSLNDCGEPIVNRPCEALHFALKKGIRIVYINNKRVELKNHAKYANQALCEPIVDIYLTEEESKIEKEKVNPYRLSRKEIGFYYWMNLFKEYSLKEEKDVKQVKRIIRMMVVAKGEDKVYIQKV
ncbi:carbamoyltransferase C-terminal domain-containing protein [Zhenhengia yiwuensis]|uniref:Carbamoyltransferase n=1 Tax=Zhenhengia yiwuensis TaxID=2763666 RepID=A0A926EI12_9FIRM|nr:carbamoyltransferase [Zhenhengia yiwuensis]